MSMSAKPARAPRDEPAPLPALEPFPYDLIAPGFHGRATPLYAGSEISAEAAAAAREQQARRLGRQEGETESRNDFAEKLASERAALSAALAAFTRDRAAYFEKVEAEVVELALSIARKILHRETQLDPLLLAGIVRVALEQIDGATGVVLRVNPQNAADWQSYLSTHLDPKDLPEIVEDASQPPDRCALETSMGIAVMGLEVQLKEIEQGLMDLLAARPESAHSGEAR